MNGTLVPIDGEEQVCSPASLISNTLRYISLPINFCELLYIERLHNAEVNISLNVKSWVLKHSLATNGG